MNTRIWAGRVVAAAAISFIAYVCVGSWQTAAALDDVLHVGGPTAQGDGWPAPQGPGDIGYVGDPGEAFGAAFRTVEIETPLGPAPAWLVAPDSGVTASSTWAIIVHGIGGRRENGYRFLPTLRGAGMPTLLMSYRNDEGAPKSPDGLYAFGLTEWTDLEAAVTYALANGADSVVLLGESMGGGIVGQFLRRSDAAHRVRAVVLDAPAVDFAAIVKDNVRKNGAPLPRLLTAGGLLVSGWKLPFELAQADVTGVFADFSGPLFLSHGTSDSIVPVPSSDRLSAERKHVTTYLRTGADHIQSWKENPARYDAALQAFLGAL